jgi:hypothetical protein
VSGTYAWMVIGAVIAWMACGFVVLLTFDSGPDWLHELCVAVMAVSGAVFILGLVLLVGSAIGISISFGASA